MVKEKITLQEALKLDFISDYHRNNITNSLEIFNNINKFHECDSEVSIEMTSENKYYVDYTNIFLKNDLCKIQIRYDSYRKKYSIFLNETFSKLTHYKITDIQKTFKAPNNIGVLSTKKLTDWVNYCQDVYKALKEENEKLTDKVEEFLKTIENENVIWFSKDNDNYKEGEIIRGGLVYKFKIDQGSITQEIKIHYKTNNTLNMFKKLSNNELLREQKINRLNDR